MSPEKRPPRPMSAELRLVGHQLSNVAYNWAQSPGYVLTEQDCKMLRELVTKWDEEARASDPWPRKAARPKRKVRRRGK